ncbi:hypothetical protein AMAG_14916 [Allomyces macrogynus ATCC 38327]|uniref:Uncharacterized protein n=1 Tax=Allomyces macrogynus (strain ATCC 38327) TaxID=578462 RepID=A0A0L0T7L0_ALLM3|nr:hypothetical protein AMAG_14916 [Allomyces macrogynus ATCC 38327]|eukprot:KNE70798.1 hypothetical protein AMAG_14916 [Allomyces macrogynus ATCC 38327]
MPAESRAAAATGPASSVPATRSGSSTGHERVGQDRVGHAEAAKTEALHYDATTSMQASDASTTGRGRTTIDPTSRYVEEADFPGHLDEGETLQRDAAPSEQVLDVSAAGRDHASTDPSRYTADDEHPVDKQQQEMKDATPGFTTPAPIRTGYVQPVMPRVIGPMMAPPVHGTRRFGAVRSGFGPAARIGNPVYYAPPPDQAAIPRGYPAFAPNVAYGYRPSVKNGVPAFAPGGVYVTTQARAAAERQADATYMDALEAERCAQVMAHRAALISDAAYSVVVAARYMM